MVQNIALVTDYGLISVFNSSMVIDRGTTLSWARVPRFGCHLRCEMIDLNFGGSRILDFVIRSAYFG